MNTLNIHYLNYVYKIFNLTNFYYILRVIEKLMFYKNKIKSLFILIRI